MACSLRPRLEAVSVPLAPHRSQRLGRRARLLVGGAALAGLFAVLATARAALRAPEIARAPEPEIEIEVAEAHVDDPSWTLSSEPIERVGYRKGRRQVIEVVPLGPTAVEVEIRTARAFLEMRAAAARDGVELRLESGFRTVEQQRELYRAWRSGQGNKAARPGKSNHQSGRALDIAVLSVPGALAWLEDNAASFGFKRTVPSEPWHWEYVDIPIARGPTKRVKHKANKAAKTARHAKRPARHHSSGGKAARASGRRVASSAR